MFSRFVAAFILSWLSMLAQLSAATATAPAMPDDFPRFVVPGHEAKMDSVRRLFWLHYQPAVPLIPLWDEWLPMSTLWPALASGRDLESMRIKWATAFAGRVINAEGYVHTQQHDGPAHAEGWPFPLWVQAGGIGWHFRGTGVPGYDAPPATPDGWDVAGGKGGVINDKGWIVHLASPRAVLQSPPMTVKAEAGPWLRLNWWAVGLEGANCYLEWTTKDQPEYSVDRRIWFSPTINRKNADGTVDTNAIETRTMIPVYRLAGWKGKITRLRIGFDNPGPAQLVIKSFHTACDTRHNINNTNFIRGCHDYFMWSLDYAFLRAQIGRLRTAMRFMMREFDTRQRKCVYTTWPGHEGRSGVRYVDGKKVIFRNEGIGSNYWDLLPFGGEDCLAGIYYYDALLDLAELEQLIAANSQWNVATGADAFDPVDLRRHAQEVKDYGTKRFWNDKTGRFGTVDLDGKMHDYGWTFLNNEAIYYDFATPEQARSIRDWISGRRKVDGDTSQGQDIYHWRFGPRSSTQRNLDYYFWGWHSPENVAWGYQVQDGGSVLGFSYHDLMASLKVDGPDVAWRRLQEILVWFDETQAAGGYRAYYSDQSRGTMQGANVPGGLGIDKEFFESILVPQTMLYGFAGFAPTADGCQIAPRLPSDWPSLTITRIHLHDSVFDLTIRQDKAIQITYHTRGEGDASISVPTGWTVKTQYGG